MDPIPPVQIGAWLGCLAFTVWIILLLLKLAERIRGKQPEPPNATLAVSSDHLAQRIGKCEQDILSVNKRLDMEISAIRAEIRENHDKAMLSGSQRGQQIYSQMDALRKEVKADIQALEDKIEAMPERVCNLLRNIKTLSD